ncbi:type II secretion system F family protein [Sporohalobacter salinus]|uniref:type II secretion system F family protein n=1 Tax=Sporohalobacter salinus TaxID=1494606 RepID=UPI001EF8DCA4|nr:type II secretion system F family protein [Sporohalobacter salinus]MBM7622730.1 type IV pilus assembly protein PilC [Sporohalobacter salinus]
MILRGEKIITQVFRYKARDENGEQLEGTLEAESKESVADRLRDRGYYIISVEENIERSNLGDILKRFRRVKLEDLAIFCRQFATMIDSGVSLVRSLDILSNQKSNHKLQEAVNSVQESVESGASLSEALEEENHVFPRLFISMVEAGETGGILDEVLLEMADYFEKENEMKQKIISVLAYPAVITLVAIAAVIFLLTFVLPTFVNTFSSLDVELPLLTRILLETSNLISSYWYVILGIGLAIILPIYYYYKTENGKRQIDLLLLKLPLISDLIIKISVARFTRTLGTLIESGVAILDGLEVVSGVVSNQIVVEQINEARNNISAGESMVNPLREGGLFPQMVLQMIRVGEETGSLDQMLNRIALFYDQEVDHKIEGMVSLIEPALILVLGLVVGSIVISIMLPMFNMIQSF